MSSQKSTLPIHTKHIAADEDLLRQGTLNVDPFAPPEVYYGESHGPRKVGGKGRTYSAVSPPYSPLDVAHSPYDPKPYNKRWTLPSRGIIADVYDAQIEPSKSSVSAFKAPLRRTSHGRLDRTSFFDNIDADCSSQMHRVTPLAATSAMSRTPSVPSWPVRTQITISKSP